MLAGVWCLYFSFGLTVTGLAPLVSVIIVDLNMSYTAMGSVLGAWQLVYIFSAVPCGALLDRLGPRHALFIGGILVAASSLGRSMASDHLTLFLAVGLLGLGGPIVSAGAPKVVSLWFHGRERGLAMGLYITGPTLGGVMALSLSNSLLMPWLNDDWRAVFQLWAAVAAVGAGIWLLVSAHPSSRAMEKRLAAEPRQSQLRVLGDLLKLPHVRLVLAMSLGIFMFNHALNNWLPELLRIGGMSAAAAGYWAAIPTAVGVCGALLIPRHATPERRFPILGALCIAAAVASLCLHAGMGPILLFGLVLQGFVRGALTIILVLTLVEMPGVQERYAGTASGLFFSAAEVGGVAGPLTLGILYDVTGGFTAGLYMLTAIAAVLTFAVLCLHSLTQRYQKRNVG
jgi:MFS transporter, CP family, cyanate transporter